MFCEGTLKADKVCTWKVAATFFLNLPLRSELAFISKQRFSLSMYCNSSIGAMIVFTSFSEVTLLCIYSIVSGLFTILGEEEDIIIVCCDFVVCREYLFNSIIELIYLSEL